jgi:hypothetical protein
MTSSAGKDALAFYLNGRGSSQSAKGAETFYFASGVYDDVAPNFEDAQIAATLASDRASYAYLQKRLDPAFLGQKAHLLQRINHAHGLPKTPVLRASGRQTGWSEERYPSHRLFVENNLTHYSQRS